MVNKIPESVTKLGICTGNILQLTDITKLTGQNQNEELVESLKLTLSAWNPGNQAQNSDYIVVSREEDATDGASKLDRDSLKISVKVFILSTKPGVLNDAMDKVFSALKVNRIDSLVLSCKLEPSAVLSSLQNIWTIVEDLVSNDMVTDVGVSDVDTDVFIALYNWAKVKPRIIQINLTVCCVVPPILQEFCKDNNVLLLTHNDAVDILPRPALYQILGAADSESLSLDWVVRYLTHIQARGVLHNKGYLMIPWKTGYAVSVSSCYLKSCTLEK